MRVYVAGAMRGIPLFNFPAFNAAAAHLREQGHEVRNPAEHDHEMGFDETQNSIEGFDLAKAFRWDIESVLWADAIAVLPGWEGSQGAAIETGVARMIGTPIKPCLDRFFE